MTTKNCLRCDWQGRSDEPTCPSCGARPLFVVGASPSVGRGTASSVTPPPGPVPHTSHADTVEPSGRSNRSVVAFVVTALVLVLTLGTWFEAHDATSATTSHGPPTPIVDPSPTPGTDDALEITDTRALARTVGGVSLTFRVPRSGWTNGPIVHPPDGGEFRQGGFAITKDTGGFQAAEAVVFWTSFSEGEHVDSCTDLLGPTDGISAADLAFAMATTPGADLVSGPSQVTIDGHRAQHVVITVRDDRGCDPGFFFSWRSECWGPCWTRTRVGDTVRVWIVDARGTRLVIEAETAKRAGPIVERELDHIVASIGLEDAPTQRTVQIAENFMEARNAFDIHEAMSLLADDGATAVLQFRNQSVRDSSSVRLSRDQLALALEAERMFGVRYEDVGCRLNGGGGSADVTCTYAMDSKLRRLAGLRPVESAARFRIRDGRIDLLSFPWLNVSWNPRGYFPKEAERFVLWLFAHYPEAIDAEHPQAVRSPLFRSQGQEWILRLNRASLDLLAGLLEEYARSVEQRTNGPEPVRAI